MTVPDGALSVSLSWGETGAVVRLETSASIVTVADPRSGDTAPSSPSASTVTRPCGMRCTGRTMPPQFHHPSRGSVPLTFETRTVSSFCAPGRRPVAWTVNGV